MKNNYSKEDLRTGDIVVLRDGEIGLVLKEEDIIVYQNSGAEWLEQFTEDLLFEGSSRNSDIVEVYAGAYSFTDYQEDDPVFEREDDGYKRTDHETFIKNLDKMKVKQKAEKEKWEKELRKQNNPLDSEEKYITVYAQAFYGRGVSVTRIPRERIDRYMLGYISETVCVPDGKGGNKEVKLELAKDEKIDRTFIDVPGTENLVIMYNKYEEEKNMKHGINPVLAIPEQNVELHSTCFICRINRETNGLESVQDGDFEMVKKYFLDC